MERDQITQRETTTQTSPSRYRLRWDAQGLVLEERQGDGSYNVRSSAGLNLAPTPVAAVHPEMEAILEQALRQFRRGWLEAAKRVDIALAPPWGNAWLLDVGNLPEDMVEEQVAWELQQRLESPLEDYIYAWHQLDDQAYAIVIRPELLAFWDSLAARNEIAVGTITLLAGLVDEEVERGADLMPLYRLWAERQGKTPAADSIDIDLEGEDEEEAEAGDDRVTAVDAGATDDEEADEMLAAILEETAAEKPGKKRKPAKRSRAVPILAVLILVVAIGSALVLLRDRFPALGDRISAIFKQNEAEEQQLNRPEAPPVTVGEQSVAKPPVTPSAGGALAGLYRLADETGVQLSDVILQGSFLRCQVEGDSGKIALWSERAADEPGGGPATVNLPVPLAQGVIVTAGMQIPDETSLTRDQFDSLVKSIGISASGAHAYTTDHDGLMRLLGVLKNERVRPFRLSIHQVDGGVVNLVMLP